MEALFLLIALFTAIASCLHGGDYLNKPVVAGLHSASVSAVVAANCINVYASVAISLFIAALYWGLFRRGKQAGAELSAMAVPTQGKLMGVVEAYLPPVVFITLLNVCLSAGALPILLLAILPAIALVVPYCACEFFNFKDNAWPPNTRNLEIQARQRRKVEFIVGLAPAGVGLALLAFNLTHLANIFLK